MEKLKPATVHDARDFFAGELRKAMHRHKVSAEPHAFEYLVSLLVKSIHSSNFFQTNESGKYEDTVLYELYISYTQASLEEKRNLLQRMGDICLLISGYFSESIQRKVVDLDYYFGMGGGAYSELAKVHPNPYRELSEKFRPFSNVLGEMSERTGLQSNKDLLRIYERWQATGSDRLRDILTEHGIAPNQSKGNKH